MQIPLLAQQAREKWGTRRWDREREEADRSTLAKGVSALMRKPCETGGLRDVNL